MPYIKQEQRIEIEKNLAELFSHQYTDGQLNYIITRLLLNNIGGNLNYAEVNKTMGVLECVKQEFYRRVAGPYEDKKIAENGDVL
jgi:hypothetical protein